MKSLGLVIIAISLLTGCMTTSRWKDNPVSSTSFSYEEQYKDTLIEVVKLDLKPNKEHLMSPNGYAISLGAMTLASKTRVYNLYHTATDDSQLVVINKYLPKLVYYADIESQGSIPFQIMSKTVNKDDDVLVTQIYGVFKFIVNPDVILLDSEIEELKKAEFQKECTNKDGSLSWCIDFNLYASVFERNQDRYTITTQKTLPPYITVSILNLKSTSENNVGNLITNTVATPILLAGDVLMAPALAFFVLIGASVQLAGAGNL